MLIDVGIGQNPRVSKTVDVCLLCILFSCSSSFSTSQCDSGLVHPSMPTTMRAQTEQTTRAPGMYPTHVAWNVRFHLDDHMFLCFATEKVVGVEVNKEVLCLKKQEDDENCRCCHFAIMNRPTLLNAYPEKTIALGILPLTSCSTAIKAYTTPTPIIKNGPI